MRTKLYSVITLFALLTLVVLPNSFAQETLNHPSVRLIYFLPNDRPARPERVAALRQLIKDTQQFYADEMQRHGFGRKIFRVETDKDGEPLVHHIDGKFTDAHYLIHTPDKVWTEIKERFDTPQHVYFCAIDISSERIGTSNIRDPKGESCGDGSEAWPGGGRELIIPASGDCFNLQIAAHELGHGFGLEHDFRENAYIMSYGGYRHQLSKCAAGWLDVHPCFNTRENTFPPRNVKIQMHAPTAAPPNGIRLRFEIGDPERLHQAQLLIPTTRLDPAPYLKLDACRLLDAESHTIEFVSSELFEVSQDEVALHVIDKHGHTTWLTFPIDIAPILPSPTFVSIPDPNLASALRKALKLAEDARIPERNLRRLTELDARKSEIKDLTGLEHAVRLRLLELRENQILDIRPLVNLKNLENLILDQNKVRDITPLANMTQLRWLLIGGNPISDFTPLANLTQLEGLAVWNSTLSDVTLLANMTRLKNLWLDRNKISDITALSKMTKLERLWLRDNQIRNVSPLVDLINLEELYLAGNPIEDLSPLQILLAKNPNLKIDIEVPRPPPPIVFSPSAIADQKFTVGEAVNLTLPIATGGTPPYTYTLAPLPEGLSFDETRRELSGRPTTAETTSATYTATDAANVSVSLTFTIEVTAGVILDVNGDGQVNVIDLAMVALFYGTLVPADTRLPADVNTDGVVDILDLTAVAQAIDATENVLSLKNVEIALLIAAEQAVELEAIPGAPRRTNTLGSAVSASVRFTTKNVADALAAVRKDVRFRKRIPAMLETFLARLTEITTTPDTTALLPNYPNPFNPETWIPYHLATEAAVVLTIYDVRGVAVRALTLGHQTAGVYESRGRAAYWDGRNESGEPVASGAYFYTLTAGDFTATRKMLIAK